MASLSNEKQSQKQRPSYTNWFTSLRRNKQKNGTTVNVTPVAAVLTPSTRQRSCLDLSSNNSVFYSSEEKNSSTDHIFKAETQSQKNAGTMSKLCAPCCGANQTTPPNAMADTNNIVTLVSKRADFLHTTTVTTTRTLVITRPVEVLLNNRGEIVGKNYDMHTRNLSRQRRSNSLDCILDGQLSPSILGVRPGALTSCDDLQYIDETTNNNNYNVSNNNNQLLHAYNEKCQFVNQAEQIDMNGRHIGTRNTMNPKIDTENQCTQNESDVETCVIMRNYNKVCYSHYSVQLTQLHAPSTASSINIDSDLLIS